MDEQAFNVTGTNIIQVDGNVSFSSSSCSSVSDFVCGTKIPVKITLNRKSKTENSRLASSRMTVKRQNDVLKALELPKIMNINPRSIYNKVEEFCQLLELYESEVIFMSET